MDNQVFTSNDLIMLGEALTIASRSMDRLITGVGDPTSDNYLMLETKTETLFGRYTKQASIVVYPRKPLVTSVSALSWRLNPTIPWSTFDNITLANNVMFDGIRVEAWDAGSRIYGPIPAGQWQTGLYGFGPREIQVQITYTGGFAMSGSDLADDIQEVACLLAIRHYKEVRSGLTDAIGVAELGQMVYTKADPVKVVKRLEPYHRVCGWRGVF